MKWMNSNKKYYTNLGYNFTNYDDEFNVNIEDIPPSSDINITGVCEECGKERIFHLKNYNHITLNQSKKYICRECYMESKILKYDVLKKDVELAGYKLLTKELEYKNGQTRIKYVCPRHGEQTMKATNFHSGRRCPKCNHENAHNRYVFSKEKVSDIVKKLGGYLLNPEDYINNETKNLKILCPGCKLNIFTTSLKHFTQHGGQSCKECSNKESVGERKIRQWLETNNIEFEQEKFFKDCKDEKQLPFDFYLPKKNIIIEYDGKQHYENGDFFTHIPHKNGMSVTEYTQYHDSIKNKYCQDNNISLIRIPYTQFNNIEKILKERLIA